MPIKPNLYVVTKNDYIKIFHKFNILSIRMYKHTTVNFSSLIYTVDITLTDLYFA